MVAYLRSNSLLALLAVFMFLGTSSSTKFDITFEGYEVDQICSETLDSSFCQKILKSNPLTEKSDVPGLEKFLVNYAQQNISDTLNQIHSILQNVTDPYSKEVYMKCSTFLKWAATYCENALKALEAKDNDTFEDAVLDVMTKLADDCRNYLNSENIKYDPQLMLKIDFLYNACDIAFWLANKFPERMFKL